ncbi:MAG: amidohydrolase family protein [Actinobacteria bacterium]|nr:amidohydrolase family protein [Actinomycetota bacterium]MCG2795773.1 amidohydrolase family protein [Actinomycetes bacterium]
MVSKETKSALERRFVAGAALAGAVGAGYMASRVRSVKAGLSSPARPYAWKPGRGQSVLLKGADLIDVRRGQTLRERGVLFKDGQITDVVATRDLEKVTADRTFDCRGLFIMPGIINAHCHALMPGAFMLSLGLLLSVKRQAARNLEECAVHGVTTVRDASSLPLVLNELGHKTEKLEMLGPRVISCGPSLMARGGYPDFARQMPHGFVARYGDLAIYVKGPESARRAVRSAVDQGARFIKIFFDDRSLFFGEKPLNVMDDKTVKALVEEAHRLGRRVGVHQTRLAGYRRALKLGVDDLEHIPTDKRLTDKDARRFMKGDHCITPTASVILALGIAPEGHPARVDPLVETMQVAREHFLRHTCPTVCEEAVMKSNLKMVKLYSEGFPADSLGSKSLFDNENFIRALAVGTPNILKLYQAGARICCGNDGGTPLSFPGTLFTEMEIMDWIGISNADILRSATINGAHLLDMEGELGSIEPGKLADVVALSSNPLKDIRAVESVEAVFRSGTLLHREYRFNLADSDKEKQDSA